MDTLSLSVGLEIEVTGGGADALQTLSRTIGIDRYTHSYHCQCREQCAPSFDRPNIVTAQDDCTVEMEFITRPFYLGDNDSWRQLGIVGDAFREARTYADPSAATGGHVHVGAALLDELPHRMMSCGNLPRFDADGREQLAQFFYPLQEALRPYLAASAEDVRDYNHPISRDWRYRDRTGWLNLRRGAPTIEVRGWNGSVVPWRWRMAAGISAALVAAVLDGARPTRKARPVLSSVLGKHLDQETRELMSRQMFYRLNNY